MNWACFKATGPGHLSVIELTTNFSVYQSIPETNIRPSVWRLKLGPNWVMQHLIEMLEHDLKRAVRKQMSANLNDVLVSLFSLTYIYIYLLSDSCKTKVI